MYHGNWHCIYLAETRFGLLVLEDLAPVRPISIMSSRLAFCDFPTTDNL